jgi:hypothetical protein
VIFFPLLAKGNLFVHCGGPSTVSDCDMGSSDSIGPDNVDNYNIISIDQVRYIYYEYILCLFTFLSLPLYVLTFNNFQHHIII